MINKKSLVLLWLFVAGCQTDQFNTAVEEAKKSAERGDYQQAIASLDGVRDNRLDQWQQKKWQELQYDYHKRLAIKAAGAGDYAQADATLKKLVELFPTAAEPPCLLARERLEAHDLERGAVALSRCMAASERDGAPELSELVQALQNEYKQQSLLADGRLDALVELVANYPDTPSGQVAGRRLPAILLQMLKNPEEAGAPQKGNPQPFTLYFRLLTVRFPDSPEAKTAIENFAEYQAAYNQRYTAELAEYNLFHDYQLGHSFCKQMELYYIKMRRVSLEVGMLVDIWIKSNNAKRMSGEERQRLAREYGHDKVALYRDDVIELREAIKNTRPATSQQKWIYGRMNTAINGLVTLQRVTDEYMATQNERARQQRNNISSWLDFFILQLNLDIQWVCPDSDALPPTVDKERI